MVLNNERIQKFLVYLTPIQYKEKELERIKIQKVQKILKEK
jgi:hypothetical protein